MASTCDAPRCNARALVKWDLDRPDVDWSLSYCGHHSDQLGPAMLAKDERWMQIDDKREPVEAYSS